MNQAAVRAAVRTGLAIKSKIAATSSSAKSG
jgi:hypothetical protein